MSVSFSPRRPVEVPAAEQVQVQVWHRLAGARLAIDNEAITVGDAEFLRQLGRDEMQVAQQFPVFRFDILMRPDDLARDDQHVHRRLRIDVAKRQAAVILMDNVRGDLAIDDLLKQIVLHHGVNR